MSLQPEDLEMIWFLIVYHAFLIDFWSKLICLSLYLPSKSLISLCLPDPPRCIKQQRQQTSNTAGILTSTSNTLDNTSLTCRKSQDHDRTPESAPDVPRSNQPKTPLHLTCKLQPAVSCARTYHSITCPLSLPSSPNVPPCITCHKYLAPSLCSHTLILITSVSRCFHVVHSPSSHICHIMLKRHTRHVICNTPYRSCTRN